MADALGRVVEVPEHLSENAGRVLVVGAGFLGRSLFRQLLLTGSPVRLLTRRPAAAAGVGAIGDTVVIGDPTDPDTCARALDGADSVVWCAGDLIPSSTAQDLASIDDLTPLVTMLRMPQLRGGRFVFLSSGGAVYGNPEHLPVTEAHPLRPISIYGAIKVQAERLVGELGEQSGVATTILRCGNAYGPGQRVRSQQGVVANAMDCIVRGRSLPVIGGLGSVRDYVFVDDITAVVEACLHQAVDAPILNLGTGEGTSLGDLLDVIRSVAGSSSTAPTPARPADVDQIILDIASLRREVPAFEPTPLPIGIKLTWESVAGVTEDSESARRRRQQADATPVAGIPAAAT